AIFFFFQAEDGIRDFHVTGVQTCALPILAGTVEKPLAPSYQEVPGGVTAPRGFRAAGLHIGVKRSRKDLALVVSDVRAAAAATFTTNRVQAAPARVTREHIKGGYLRDRKST